MPVTLPSAYGGLSQGLSQGFGMMNLIDRTKMAKQEQAENTNYRNSVLALKKMEQDRIATAQEFSKVSSNVNTFLNNIKDLPYDKQSQAISLFIPSLPDNMPMLKSSLQSINFLDKEQFKAETKASGEFEKIMKTGVPKVKDLYGFAANNVDTKAGQIALAYAKNLEKQDSMTSDIKNYALAAQQGYQGDFNTWYTNIKKAGATKINIGDKQRQQDIATLNSPKFIAQVSKDAKQMTGTEWDLLGPKEKGAAIKAEADKRVKIVYPNAQFGELNGKKGWYVKDEKGQYTLVTPWSE